MMNAVKYQLHNSYVEQTADRMCIILIGQIRFVGTKQWETHIVSLIKQTVEQFPNIPVDIKCCIWEYDTFRLGDLNKEQKDTHGFPLLTNNINNVYTTNFESLFFKRTPYKNKTRPQKLNGIVKVKKDDIIDYFATTFSFVNDITVDFFDYYSITNDINYLMFKKYKHEIKDMHFNEIGYSSGLGWNTQHIVNQYLVARYPEYFDNFTEHTAVVKTRYDIVIEADDLTLWDVCAGLYYGDVDYGSGLSTDGIVPMTSWSGNDKHVQFNKHFYDDPKFTKIVSLQGGSRSTQILNGVISTNDTLTKMTGSAYQLYATEYVNWIMEDPLLRTNMVPGCIYNKFNVDKGINRRLVPESLVNDFFIDHKTTITYDYLCHDVIGMKVPNPQLFKFLAKTTDLHQYHWYEWTIKAIESIGPIDDNLL